jgi:hypothetical protein
MCIYRETEERNKEKIIIKYWLLQLWRMRWVTVYHRGAGDQEAEDVAQRLRDGEPMTEIPV